MTTTNFNYGISNALNSSTLGAYVAPDPTLYHTHFDDFDQYTTADWVITTVGSSTIGTIDANNGILSVATGASDNDHDYFQWAGNTASSVLESWLPTTGKQLFFKTRFSLSAATESDFFAGLYVTDTDPVGAITDGMYFHKADGATTLNFVTVASSTATTTPVATIAASTFVSVGFHYDGYNKLNLYVNDNRVASSAITNIPATELALSFAVQAGTDAAVTLLLDYLFVSEER
jgi:hypothetical protein